MMSAKGLTEMAAMLADEPLPLALQGLMFSPIGREAIANYRAMMAEWRLEQEPVRLAAVAAEDKARAEMWGMG